MELHLKIVGFLLIALSLIHIFFPRYFNWANELTALSMVNRQMIYVHTFFIALILTMMGLLCITSSRELIETNLGNKLALGLGVFWGLRLLIQFFGHSPQLWRGKKLETLVHVLFSGLWIYLSTVFLCVYGNSRI